MKVLFLCNKPPYPPRDGGALAMNALIEGMADAGHQVHVLAVNASKYHLSSNDIPASYRQKVSIQLVSVDLDIKPVPALISTARSESYHVKRFRSAAFEKKLTEELKKGFDIVQLETIYPGVYLDTIRKNSKAKIILRAHNIEHQIWEQYSVHSMNPFKRFLLKKMITKLRDFELSLFSKVDGIAAITDRESKFAELATCSVPVKTIPFGINPEKYPFIEARGSLNCFHIGSMDWMPNQEGIRWFLDHVWPLVLDQKPDASLVLAGRNMPPWLLNTTAKGVTIAGEVTDSWTFICQNGVMVVPLLSGSGIRIKIVEGMLAGKTVITTTKGAEGMDCSDGEHLLLADDPQKFSFQILTCLNQPPLMEAIGEKARTYVLKKHDNRSIIQDLENFYVEVLSYS